MAPSREQCSVVSDQKLSLVTRAPIAASTVSLANWWNERDSNPHHPLARRGLSQLSYHPIAFAAGLPAEAAKRRRLVPGVGFEPTSPRFRRGAFTRLASQANWCGRGESNSFRRSGAPALNQSTTSAWCAPEDSNLSSADLPVSKTPVLQTGGRRGTRVPCCTRVRAASQRAKQNGGR